MVEESDDGRLRPVVMDFGIARELGGDSGITEAGALIGTPAYMSPEQARGNHELIDRRTDVYSLGATLYELLTGKSPFAGEAIVDVLFKIIYRDPEPPRKLVAGLPNDLQTIVLKCLSKEADQRYDSAKALADDLQRYIEGEPILARKHSLRYRAGKFIRKHKAMVAISVASFLWFVVLGVDAIRNRIESNRRARISAQRVARARQLGQNVKEIEWFMRAVYELPLHDTSYEQGLIRTRIGQLEEQLDEMGGRSSGLAHYAIGRGYMALHEYPRAYSFLVESFVAGNQSLELHHALGRVLGQRYYEAISAERRSGDAAWFEVRRQKLEKEFLEPAKQHLQQSRGIQLESTSYLEGLIAYYDHRFDEALAHADTALREAPWLYEAKLLKGDVYYARAESARVRGDRTRLDADIESAIRMYEDASAIGRSDVSVYEAAAEAWLFKLQEHKGGETTLDAMLPAALKPCRDAIRISPQRTRGYQLSASMYLQIAEQKVVSGGDPTLELKAMRAIADEGAAHGAMDAYLHNALGNGALYTLMYEDAHGKPHSVQISDVIKSQEQAIALKPDFPWAFNDLAGAFTFRGNARIARGEDPHDDLYQTVQTLEKATRIYRGYATAYSNSAFARYLLASYLVDRGQDPTQEIGYGVSSAAACSKSEPDKADCLSQLLLLRLTEARYFFMKRDGQAQFSEALQKAFAASAAAEQHGDQSVEHQQALATAYLLQARSEKRQNGDVQASIAQAEGAIAECRKLSPDDASCALLNAEIALFSLQAQRDAKGAAVLKSADSDHLLEVAEQAVTASLHSGDGYRLLAAARLFRGELQLARKKLPQVESEITAGLHAVAQSLERNPRQARTLATRGSLELLRAQLYQRTQDARRASSAADAALSFKQASKLNPLLADEYASQIAEAERSENP